MPENEVEFRLKLLKIADKIKAIEKAGNGEVRILIKNSAIYRILKTEDELVGKTKS